MALVRDSNSIKIGVRGKYEYSQRYPENWLADGVLESTRTWMDFGAFDRQELPLAAPPGEVVPLLDYNDTQPLMHTAFYDEESWAQRFKELDASVMAMLLRMNPEAFGVNASGNLTASLGARTNAMPYWYLRISLGIGAVSDNKWIKFVYPRVYMGLRSPGRLSSNQRTYSDAEVQFTALYDETLGYLCAPEIEPRKTKLSVTGDAGSTLITIVDEALFSAALLQAAGWPYGANGLRGMLYEVATNGSGAVAGEKRVVASNDVSAKSITFTHPISGTAGVGTGYLHYTLLG